MSSQNGYSMIHVGKVYGGKMMTVITPEIEMSCRSIENEASQNHEFAICSRSPGGSMMVGGYISTEAEALDCITHVNCVHRRMMGSRFQKQSRANTGQTDKLCALNT